MRIACLLLLVSLCCLLAGCERTDKTARDTQSLVEENRNQTVQTRVNPEYARGFRVSYHSDHTLLEVLNPYQDRTDTLRYLLISRGDDPPETTSGAQVIETPVRSMIATSTTHLALTDMLEANEIVKGITQPEYVYSPEIRERLREGEITPFTGGEFNREQALAMNPDLIMISGGMASQIDNYRVLMDSGIDVLVNSEWLERTPLGKAEWVKMMALLINREGMANEKFARVEKRYLELKHRIEGVSEKPLVINNMPYKGAWFVSGGGSFTAQYLKDAGAAYPWFDTETTGGLRMDFEAVYEVGLRADIWLNPGGAGSLEDIAAADSRFTDFKSYESGEIYNSNRRMSPTGGNDFWESGVVHPETVLADLIHILHPDRLPDHRLYYYRKLD